MKPSTQHTPGPWKAIHTPTRKETFWAIATTNDAPIQAVIALVDGISKAHQESPEMAEGNARLIASAPLLLAACIQAARTFEDLALNNLPALIPEARQMLADAINSANGGAK